ncbi:MAG TPA: dTDP-glucose 4,6-dehydratase [Bacteroidota bacterium]|nr:dTDP-glucose 4,6-dehydratase [Bacteroidota bacterium]
MNSDIRNVLVTGGAGFIGSNFVRHLLRSHGTYRVVNLDALTYAGNLENLHDVELSPRYAFVKGDICDAVTVEKVMTDFAIHAVVHFAAESHVDRSIMGPTAFVQTNVLGTSVLLEAARKNRIDRFVHVSTDEVYGSLGPAGRFSEDSPLHPNSPYSASKAASDLLALAHHHTFGTPVVVTRCSNNYGPYQFPEKLIPLMIVNALHDKPLPVYGDGLNVRDWLSVDDHCRALDCVLHSARDGEVYNIGGNNEMKNIDIVRLILQVLGKPQSLITFIKDRPGHDRRYAIDATKLTRELQWKPERRFEEALPETIGWYLEHREWWERILSGEYQRYYERQYSERLGKEPA